VRWIAVSFKTSQNPQETAPPFDSELLYELAARYSPTVCWKEDLHSPWRGWLIEVESCFRLFGGEQALLGNVWAQFEPFMPMVGLGTYPTATGAWWLSKSTRALDQAGFLEMLTIAETAMFHMHLGVLDTPPKVRATWQQCGFSTLSDLKELPRDGLVRRFGIQTLQELDAGFGNTFTNLKGPAPHQPTETFEIEVELPFHTQQFELIENHANTLLEQLCAWLHSKKQGTRELNWCFKLAHENICVTLRSAKPSNDQKTWERLFHHKVQQREFKDDVRSLRLSCMHTEVLAPNNSSLFPSAQDQQNNWDHTCDLLRARLGEHAILFAGAQQDPRPEFSVVLESKPIHTPNKTIDKTHAMQLAQGGIQASSPRPLWLLHSPLPLKGKPPNWAQGGPWQLVCGPERIQFGWWDNAACQRDYYCAIDSNGRMVWVYQDLNGSSTQADWFLHGYFA
jgi:protein ImuB